MNNNTVNKIKIGEVIQGLIGIALIGSLIFKGYTYLTESTDGEDASKTSRQAINFVFEVAKGTYKDSMIGRRAEIIRIINRSSEICENAILVANDYYKISLENTSFGFPTGMKNNSNKIDIGQSVTIVNPRTLGGSNFYNTGFKDEQDRALGTFGEIFKIRIICSNGAFDGFL